MAQQKKKTTQDGAKQALIFGKVNYQLMLVGIAIVIFGFILMSGKTDIYSFTKITVAPIVVVLGFAVGVVAILKDPKKDSN